MRTRAAEADGDGGEGGIEKVLECLWWCPLRRSQLPVASDPLFLIPIFWSRHHNFTKGIEGERLVRDCSEGRVKEMGGTQPKVRVTRVVDLRAPRKPGRLSHNQMLEPVPDP